MLSNELHIKGSKTMPCISFKNGRLDISGRSITQNTNDWSEPLTAALNAYAKNSGEAIQINIHLDYLNSDSTRKLYHLLVIAESIFNSGKKVEIKWFYNHTDLSMLDQGNIFKSLIEVPFRMEPLN